jgi:nucleotide-binding universal stress UspA family protein
VVVNEQEKVTRDQQVMGAVAAQVAEITPQPTLVPLVGFSDEVILNYLAQTPAHLLIMGAFGDRGAGASQAIGVMAQRVVQQAPIPVLMVKGHQAALRKLLVCADVDDPSVVEFASKLAKRVGAQLDLLHVAPSAAPSPLAQPTSTISTVETALQQEPTLAMALPTWVAHLTSQGYGREQIHLRQGGVAESILAEARQGDYDLVIVGSQANAGHFAHTVAHSVVSFAEQPVLVLRARPRT